MKKKFGFKSFFSWKSLFRFGFLLCIAYLAFGGYFFFCDQGEWFTKPNAEPSSYRETTYEHVPMKLVASADDPAEVHFRKYPARQGPVKGTIYYLHGNKGNMEKCESEIEIFLQKGYDVWTMDYRGFGDSTGVLSENALVDDAKRVYDEIIFSGVNESDIVIWGRSFGSGVAASIVAADTKPKMLVLETPYWSLPEVARSNYLILPDFLFHYQLPTHEYLSTANSECRIELIHGTFDEKIPFSSSERLYLRCLELNLSVGRHPIMCGLHDLRPDEEFEVIVHRILR